MQLDQLLADLNSALRDQDYTRLNAISAMLETVLIPTDRAALQRAARLADENRSTLAAAARGVRAAQRRLAELRAGQRLTTYDNAGRRIERPAPNGKSHRV